MRRISTLIGAASALAAATVVSSLVASSAAVAEIGGGSAAIVPISDSIGVLSAAVTSATGIATTAPVGLLERLAGW